MHTGPGAHILNYPIAQHTLSNMVVFVTDDTARTIGGIESREVDRGEIIARFENWRPEVRALVRLLPENPVKWRLFDFGVHPAPSYVHGRVGLAGDAAHASSPHHGAGAGMGVEDALALATALKLAADAPLSKRNAAIAAALEAYNDTRYDRTQWLVRSSRETGDIYEWMYPESGSDPVRIKAELNERQSKIRSLDVDKMVSDTESRYHIHLS
jgi:salicylate hydroxylase